MLVVVWIFVAGYTVVFPGGEKQLDDLGLSKLQLGRESSSTVFGGSRPSPWVSVFRGGLHLNQGI